MLAKSNGEALVTVSIRTEAPSQEIQADGFDEKLRVEIHDLLPDDWVVVPGDGDDDAIRREGPEENRRLKTVVLTKPHVGQQRIRNALPELVASVLKGVTHHDVVPFGT